MKQLPLLQRLENGLNLFGIVFGEAVNFRSKLIKIFEATIDRGKSNKSHFI